MVLSTEWSQVEVIDLINDGNGLGFILVGGRSTGVVIKALTPGGVAERDGRLQCGDHLLQIGEVNLRGFSSEQVATVLRQTGAQVRLIVARPVEPTATDFQTLACHAPIIPTKLLSDPEELSRHLFHNSSNSFATITTNSATCVGSGVDCFLPTPDTELADLPLPPIPTELSSTAASATATRMCPKDLDIVPFSIVSPPTTLLPLHKTAGTPTSAMGLTTTTPLNTRKTTEIIETKTEANKDHIETVIAGITASNLTIQDLPYFDADQFSNASSSYIDSPETETYEVELRKNVYGLGITVAGYICEEEELSGIFVKSIIEGSAAEMSGKIQINDRIVAVDGRTLSGVTNHQAVEILRNTDIKVHLTLERFLRGRKYEHLQNALTELKAESRSQSSLPPSPSIATLTWIPPRSEFDSIDTDNEGMIMEINDMITLPSHDTVDSNISQIIDNSDSSYEKQSPIQQNTPKKLCDLIKMTNGNVAHLNGNALDSGNDTDEFHDEITNYQMNKKLSIGGGSKTPTMENLAFSSSTPLAEISKLNLMLEKTEISSSVMSVPVLTNEVSGAVKATTSKITTPTSTSVLARTITTSNMDALKVAWKSEFPESEIIVAEINKLSGLGISLEGTVDVECGIEKRPHHYIRSILEDGPVGRQGILKPGDELLQVNEHKLQGLNHTEVVRILKELPSHVKLVCARGPKAPSVINTSQNAEAFETRSLLPGGHLSLQNLMTKAQSESSLYTSSTATLTDQQRSKSLENVSGLALWCSDVTIIEIEKTENGFGFSILDYQDPLDAEGTVIVIRGLIRGGAAEATNEIFPGDRLISVGDKNLQGLDLDEAVTILKGMPKGITKLGICRPLSTSDSNIASPIEEAICGGSGSGSVGGNGGGDSSNT